MTDKPLVSVLMITYNHEKYIEEAVNGVLNQKCDFEFELIIANDYSSDKTDGIIQRIIVVHPRANSIKYICHDRNIGMIANFIDLVKRSNGEYVAICEGDDYWTDSTKLQKQVSFLQNNSEYSMCCHDALILDEIHNSLRTFFTAYHRKQICSTKDTLNIHFCPTSSIVFRKDAILAFNETEIYNTAPMAGDHLLVQLLSLKGLINRIQEVMSVYRHHINGMGWAAQDYLSESLTNRITSLKFLNKISEKKFQKNIRIEILLIKNRIQLIKSKSKVKTIALKIQRKGLGYYKKNFLKIK